MDELFEIYFEDLKPEVQKEFLKFYKIKDQYQMNWDVFPIAKIEKPKEDLDYKTEERNNDH